MTRPTASARLRRTGGRPPSKRSGRPQVEDLIDAARVSVFLLDEHQVVKPGERGSVADIESAATRLGCEVIRVDLNDQFRLGGSRPYEEWVLRLLGLEPGGPVRWAGSEAFESRRSRLPARQWRRRLQAHMTPGYSSRIAAGYCWSWSKPEGRLPVPRCQDRWLEASLEQPQGHPRRRRARPTVLGDRPRRLRPGGLHLHGAGLRV